ncbi:MAG: hypothetical protein ABR567_23080 [Myxococcales bacterium]|nr:hypothetical protein [Myxococcales bacterium]
MIRAPYDRPEVLEKLRPAFAAQRSLILPGACDPKAAPRVRWRRFDLANRGRYDFAELRPMTELHRFAEALAGARLKPAWTRLYRFRHGGYALFFDDAHLRVESGIELTLDLSRQVAGPPVVYQSSPTSRLEVPQVPGIVAIVERSPATYRYDRYFPAEVGRASVLRLRAAFEYGR